MKNYYEFLLAEAASGNLKRWLQLGAPSQLPKWMEIMEYHLLHPELTQEKLPFEVESIESPFLHPTLPYKLYYAQAWWLVQNGFNYWFDTDDIRALETHTESFRRETSEEQLLPIYYTAVPSSNESAVFRTTAEISANLVFRGNIKHPMDLRALGRVMSAMGYVSKRLGKTRARGFLVIENQVNSSTALALAQKIRAQEMADKADKGQEVF